MQSSSFIVLSVGTSTIFYRQHLTSVLLAGPQASKAFAQGVEQIDGLELCGRPDMCVVAFKASSRQVNIYKVNDLMTNKGWHLNALQFPASIHMCFTAQHTEVVPKLLKVMATANHASNHATCCCHQQC